MRITSIALKHFRCFPTLQLTLDNPVCLLTGSNGIGKTSLIEALHFACYLRSFKTHLPKELIQLSHESFSIVLKLDTTTSSLSLAEQALVDQDTVAVHVAGSKKAVKINQQAITSYKELRERYKVITITEDDLDLIKGPPASRRAFLDQLITLIDPTYTLELRSYKTTLENRNALFTRPIVHETYHLWTEQLLIRSQSIQKRRKEILEALQARAQYYALEFFGEAYTLNFSYEYARPYIIHDNIDDFLNAYPNLARHESAFHRSLFGVHLDDMHIVFQEKASRAFASRGQQKLMVFLLKLAQLDIIAEHNHKPKSAIFLIDDFMTDFDEHKINALFPLIMRSASQIIITSPLKKGFLHNKLLEHNAQIISLEQ